MAAALIRYYVSSVIPILLSKRNLLRHLNVFPGFHYETGVRNFAANVLERNALQRRSEVGTLFGNRPRPARK